MRIGGGSVPLPLEDRTRVDDVASLVPRLAGDIVEINPSLNLLTHGLTALCQLSLSFFWGEKAIIPLYHLPPGFLVLWVHCEQDILMFGHMLTARE